MKFDASFIEYIYDTNVANTFKKFPSIDAFLDGNFSLDESFEICRIHLEIQKEKLFFAEDFNISTLVIFKVNINIEYIDDLNFSSLAMKNFIFYKSMLISPEQQHFELKPAITDVILDKTDDEYYIYLPLRVFTI